MLSNNVVRQQPGSACKLLRTTSPGAAPQQRILPVVGRSRWRIPRDPTGTGNACVTHTSFLSYVSPALGMNKISPCTGHQFWDVCANKDRLEKALGRSGRPHNFSVDNDEFCYPNTKQEENRLVMSRPFDYWTEMKSFSLADCQMVFFLTGLYSLSWDILTLFKEAFHQRAKLQNRRGRDGNVRKSFPPPALCYRKAVWIHKLHKFWSILHNLDSEFLPQWSHSGTTIQGTA